MKITESQLRNIIRESLNEIISRGNRIYLDDAWYMLPDGNGEFDVFDDGEWEGKYCGSLERLQTMSPEDALDYVLSGL